MLEKEIQDIVSAHNILDVVEKCTHLNKKDENFYIGVCPFHPQRTPSFLVNSEMQEFHCLECGRRGNLFNFVYECKKQNIDDTMHFFNKHIQKNKDSVIYKIYTETAKYYYENMKTEKDKKTYKYFKNRGFSDKTINHFGLGYSKYEGLYSHLSKLGFEKEQILNSGLCRQNEKGVYDFFRNRAMIPIIDKDGRICAFGGRTMGEDNRKYINSSEHDVFFKGSTLFAFNFAKKSFREGLICCEGYMDVIAMHQAGFNNAVASLGTAFTNEHAQLIRSHTDKVWLAYDNDEAGIKATIKNIQILRTVGIEAKIINLSPYKDPDELIKSAGSTEYEKRLKNAKDGIFFEIDILFSNCKEEKSFKEEVTKLLLPHIKSINDMDKYVGYVNSLIKTGGMK